MLNFWMTLFALAFLLLLSSTVQGAKFEAGVNIGGDGSVGAAADNSKSAVFMNGYKDQILYLFWRGDDGTSVKMGQLSRGASANINTFVDHTFFATFDMQGTQRAYPYQVGE